ncbi:S-adenosyl methyltransferase [Pseudonocardia sediminis]|uniref:S-adenosyl methyltransferase n=1 Tax=Pseudonocardia sediminis TaxID=1397368 RepID=A0A4Q7UTT3_PSEST|nr:SAM-dependent methyltransferase [Pseudonocardia sediminis]RZT84288.1 S-adenosyl methyltransferase [Pseudonocardia sediminis]
MTQGERRQAPIDLNVPSVARCYDFALGGKDNYEVDRAAVAAVESLIPEAGVLAKVNRAWHIRATRFLAGTAGIHQYLDLGAGLPTVENTHEVAQRIDAHAHVVYVDNDPSAVAHGKALLDDDDLTRYVEGDLTKPAQILDDPVVRSHLDFSEPIGLYQSATLHHQPDEADLPGIMREYVAALAPGSYVVLSHFWDPGGEAGAMVRRIREIMLEQGLDGEYFRTREQILPMLDGLELVPGNADTDEGLVPLLEWWPDGPPMAEPGVVPQCIVGAVGRKA